MSDLLKPCPMCGGSATEHATYDLQWIECDKCQLQTESCSIMGDEDPAPLWNYRVPQSDWVSVDYMLPEKCKHNDLSVCVLVYSEINKCIYTAVYDYLSRKFFHFSSLDELLSSESVCYWMPLPNPPEVK